jgi:hypothetical protein
MMFLKFGTVKFIVCQTPEGPQYEVFSGKFDHAIHDGAGTGLAHVRDHRLEGVFS